MKMKLTLFSQWDCKTCIALKEVLNSENVNYKTIEVIKNIELWESIRESQSKISKEIMYTPTLLVEKDKKQVYIAAGRDFNTPEEALEILKQYL